MGGEIRGEGFSVRIQKVGLRPHGRSLLLELGVSAKTTGWFEKRIDGTVYLLAEPRLNSDEQTITLSGVELDTHSRSALVAVLGEAAEPRLLEAINERRILELDTVLKQLLNRANSAVGGLSSDDLDVDARIRKISLTRLEVGPEYLRGVAVARGSVRVSVREIPF